MSRLAALAVAGLIVLAANVFLLAGIVRNRSAAVQTVELTERELPLEKHGEENSRIDLSLLFVTTAGTDALNLQERIGANVSRPFFLEYAGPAWERARKVYVNSNQEYTRRLEATESRLVPVDAALDSETLRSKYGSKYLIVRVRRWALASGRVHVPLPLARKLSALARQPTSAYFSANAGRPVNVARLSGHRCVPTARSCSRVPRVQADGRRETPRAPALDR